MAELMTIIALIPYKDGVLTISDSRGTIALPFVALYKNRMKKTFVSKDGDLTIAGSGGADIIVAATYAMFNSEPLLKQYLKDNDSQTEKELEARISKITRWCMGNASSALLMTVRLDDGTIKTVYADINPAKLPVSKPKTKLYQIPDGGLIADGLDGTVQDYLDALADKYYLKSKIELADALAVGFMLEDRYMEKNYTITYRLARVHGVGGAIKAHAMDFEKSNDISIVISKAERERLEGRSYEELRAYFAEKIAARQGFKELLRTEPSASAHKSKSASVS